MITRWSVPLAGLALALGSVAYAAPAMAATPAPHAATSAELAAALNPGGLFKAAPDVRHTLLDGKVLSYSGNWSGYAITGGTFTTTTASWTQPTITCTSGDGETDMSPWVGIDGYSSDTVEQTGSSGDCDGSSKDYYAWYEMYPANVVVINKTVKAGDKFTGTVTHTTGTKYTLVLEDVTQGWTNSVTKSISDADDSSAEAVEEMAANNLTKFSTDPFTGFTVDGDAAGSFPSADIQQMEITTTGDSSGTLCDSTSALTSEENFTVTWLNAC